MVGSPALAELSHAEESRVLCLCMPGFVQDHPDVAEPPHRITSDIPVDGCVSVDVGVGVTVVGEVVSRGTEVKEEEELSTGNVLEEEEEVDTGALVEEENAELVGSIAVDVPVEELGSWEVEGVLEGRSEVDGGVEVVGGTGVELEDGGVGVGVLEEIWGVEEGVDMLVSLDLLVGVDDVGGCELDDGAELVVGGVGVVDVWLSTPAPEDVVFTPPS